jgi:hypothetical protein
MIDLLSAWRKAFSATDEQQALAEMRLRSCRSCHFYGELCGVPYCRDCGCPLKGKVYASNRCRYWDS